MPSLIVVANIPLIDMDGEDHRLRKEIDLWGDLTAAQQSAVTNMMNRVTQVLQTRYGASALVEAVRYTA